MPALAGRRASSPLQKPPPLGGGELTVERTCAGLEAARHLGRTGGRKRRMTESKVQSAKKLLASGIPPREVAKNLGVSVPTLYRWIPASSQS